MAPRTRGKAARGARRNKQPAKLGKLDVTPTNHHIQSPHSNPKAPVNQPRPNPQADEFNDGVNDGDLIQLECSQQAEIKSSQGQNFSWSDGGSMTRRSSPLHESHTTGGGWQFDESDAINPLSSPRSGLDMLPDTVPLPSGPPPDTKLSQSPAVPKAHVDLSETASTMLRSSPYTAKGAPGEIWQFNESTLHRGQGPSAHDGESRPQSPLPASPPAHYPIDELYEATPPKPRPTRTDSKPIQANVKRGQPNNLRGPTLPSTKQEEEPVKSVASKGQKKMMKDLLIAELGPDNEKPFTNPEETQGCETISPTVSRGERQTAKKDKPLEATDVPRLAPLEDASAKKRKQRAKTPIQFDEVTNQIKEMPRKKAHFSPEVASRSTTKKTAQPSKAATDTKKRSAPNATTKKEPLAKKQKAAPKPKGKLSQSLAYKNVATVGVGTRKGKPAKPTLQKLKTESSVKKPNHKEDVGTGHIGAEHILISSDDSESLSDSQDSPQFPRPNQPAVASRNVLNPPTEDDSEPPAKSMVVSQPSIAQDSIAIRGDNESSTHQPLNPVQGAQESAKSSNASKAGEPCKRITRSMMKNVSNEAEKAKVLTPRDPNKVTAQTTRFPRQKGTRNPGALERPEAPSRPIARKSTKASRSFSVSEVGSPVPAAPDQGRPLKGHQHNWNKETSPQFLGD